MILTALSLIHWATFIAIGGDLAAGVALLTRLSAWAVISRDLGQQGHTEHQIPLHLYFSDFTGVRAP